MCVCLTCSGGGCGQWEDFAGTASVEADRPQTPRPGNQQRHGYHGTAGRIRTGRYPQSSCITMVDAITVKILMVGEISWNVSISRYLLCSIVLYRLFIKIIGLFI